MSVLVKLRFRTKSSYQEAVSTLHCTLKNGSDLHVNACQKIDTIRARSTEEGITRRKKNSKLHFLLRKVRT